MPGPYIDSFTDTAATNLNAHTADSGFTYSGALTSLVIGTNGTSLKVLAGTDASYWASPTDLSLDQYCKAVLVALGAGNLARFNMRADAGATPNGAWFAINGTGQVVLGSLIAGAYTVRWTSTATSSAGDEICAVASSAQPPVFTIYKNGVLLSDQPPSNAIPENDNFSRFGIVARNGITQDNYVNSIEFGTGNPYGSIKDILYGGSHRGIKDGMMRGVTCSDEFVQRRSRIFVPRNYERD